MGPGVCGEIFEKFLFDLIGEKVVTEIGVPDGAVGVEGSDFGEIFGLCEGNYFINFVPDFLWIGVVLHGDFEGRLWRFVLFLCLNLPMLGFGMQVFIVLFLYEIFYRPAVESLFYSVFSGEV